MDISSVNFKQIDLEIDNILSDITSLYSGDEERLNISIPDNNVSAKEIESACKIFGCGTDK